ncbi:MAG TPA: GtrA family protein [Caulobacteraceae bacterium]|jgi:putative flippase GtrA|nr:GtrA family protein [Caulobacteraceae bacterium]
MIDAAPPKPSRRQRVRHETRTALKYSAVSMTGFATDFILLKTGLAFGLEPAWARVISLTVAMQVTFFANGFLVFRRIRHRRRAMRQWFRYVLTNAVGNGANYFIYLAFFSSRLPVISMHIVALSCGGLAAWMINYFSTRWLVFRHGKPGFVWPWRKAGALERDWSPP